RCRSSIRGVDGDCDCGDDVGIKAKARRHTNRKNVTTKRAGGGAAEQEELAGAAAGAGNKRGNGAEEGGGALGERWPEQFLGTMQGADIRSDAVSPPLLQV